MSAMEDSLRQHLAQFDPTPTDDDIAAEGFDGGERIGGWRVTDAGSADWALRRIADAEKAQRAAIALAEQQIAQVNAWLEGETAKTQRTIDFFTGHLADYHRDLLAADPKAKTISLPHGKLVSRVTPDRVEVDEAEVAALPDGMKRVKVEPDKKAILAHVKATGELPVGVTLIPGEIRFSVKTGGDE